MAFVPLLILGKWVSMKGFQALYTYGCVYTLA